MDDSWTIVILLLAVASLILFLFLIIRTLFPTKKYDKNLGLILIILSLLAIPISMFLIGGWAGMGIGIIAVLIFAAVIIALIANKFIKLPPPKKIRNNRCFQKRQHRLFLSLIAFNQFIIIYVKYI
ncbi:hypothetical protein COO00_06345 [Bacillus toyonensis]|nr:hypothetical protein IIS_01118 [Bacillus cereus VD131]OFD03696.1 hypothetical protein BTGOE5_11190 [Bacillus thuringiensis]PDZ82504.1 hypothetical protein CON93_26120 [Bacillus toyonensis]OFD09182.1 hypothetical protein BTGOE7_11520 [Bacillus thuringiensis]PEA31061.1 hypothetical protein COO13_22120 [Bacillus toyonensis]